MDVELIQINPRLGATAVLNGDVDFTTMFGSTLRGIIGGFPIKFVTVSVRKSEHFLVAWPEFKEIKGIKGKAPRSVDVRTPDQCYDRRAQPLCIQVHPRC